MRAAPQRSFSNASLDGAKKLDWQATAAKQIKTPANECSKALTDKSVIAVVCNNKLPRTTATFEYRCVSRPAIGAKKIYGKTYKAEITPTQTAAWLSTKVAATKAEPVILAAWSPKAFNPWVTMRR